MDLQSIFNLMDTHKYRYCQVTASGSGAFCFDWSTGRGGRGDCVTVRMGEYGRTKVTTSLWRVGEPIKSGRILAESDSLYAYLKEFLDDNKFIPGTSGYPAVVEWIESAMHDPNDPSWGPEQQDRYDKLLKEWWGGVEPTPKRAICGSLLEFNEHFESAKLANLLMISSDGTPAFSHDQVGTKGFTVLHAGGINSYELRMDTYFSEKKKLRKVPNG